MAAQNPNARNLTAKVFRNINKVIPLKLYETKR